MHKKTQGQRKMPVFLEMESSFLWLRDRLSLANVCVVHLSQTRMSDLWYFFLFLQPKHKLCQGRKTTHCLSTYSSTGQWQFFPSLLVGTVNQWKTGGSQSGLLSPSSDLWILQTRNVEVPALASYRLSCIHSKGQTDCKAGLVNS